MIFQEPMTALNPVLPIGLQIDEALVAHTILGRAARRKRAIELLGLVGIPSAAERLAQLPARVLGRHAPARDDRHRAGGASRSSFWPTSRRRRSTSRSRTRS